MSERNADSHYQERFWQDMSRAECTTIIECSEPLSHTFDHGRMPSKGFAPCQHTTQPNADSAPHCCWPSFSLSVFVMPISISGAAIALPAISGDLGTSPTALQWIINGFNAAFAVFTLVWGIASDRIGYRATFLSGLVVILAASVLSALSPDLLTLDIARLLAGAGGAAVFTGGAALLSNAFEGARRARAFALFGTTIGLGLALGPTLSGGLVAGVGWRGVFGLFGVVMALALLGARSVPRIRHERQPGEKAVDFSLLRNRKYLAMVLVPVAAAIGYVTVLSYLPVALSAVHGMSAGTAGLFILPMTIPVLVGPVIASTLISRVRRVSAMTMINAALVSLTLGDMGLLFLSPDTGAWALAAPMILLGFGFGFPIGLVDGEALAAVPARSSGTAAGVLNFMRLGSEAIVVGGYAAVLTALLRARFADPQVAQAGAPGHGGIYPGQFHWIVLAMAILTAALMAVINALPASHVRTTPAHPGTAFAAARKDEEGRPLDRLGSIAGPNDF
ncbi:MFS transporter [Streptomyces dubilierae]|uniref:MFS transporter n=1 Tax=Streptomyces dubilierae TaxID=3075533 RepID=A0ABU2P1J2_9ACTN|nr:MFS transporter [Streptomyces sp. DSM 41921]MDT0386003.1 MFS transporter [Streptomyces sp. DSM 41921]